MRFAIAFGCGLIGLAGMIIPPASADDQEASLGSKAVDEAVEPDTFVGTYRIKSGADDGKAIPADRLDGSIVRITEEVITVLDRDENALYACTYELKPDHTPARLDMVSTGGPSAVEGRKARGIITEGTGEREGLVLLCYRTVGEEYPEDFRPRAGLEENLFVLEPVEDDDDNGDGR